MTTYSSILAWRIPMNRRSIKTCRVTERNQSLGVAWSEDAYRAEVGWETLKAVGVG